MSDHEELRQLAHRMADGTATSADAARLSERLRGQPELRDAYLGLIDTHAALCWEFREAVNTRERLPGSQPMVGERPAGILSRESARRSLIATWLPWSVAVVATVVVAVVVGRGLRPTTLPAEIVARFVELSDCRWVSATAPVQAGEAIQRGERIELAAGSARIQFKSGAVITLVGPAIFEPQSTNAGFLMLGQLTVLAETPRSKGFTVQTRTSKLIDRGTKFSASAAADGRSRIDVSAGEVDVQLEGVERLQRLRVGDSLSIEPGQRQVLTRIESGDGAPAFRFPTIEPPSDQDDANQSDRWPRRTMHRLAGRLSQQSAVVDVLLDGAAQSQPDSPRESVFFDDDQPCLLVLDLGQVEHVTKVNTYSWHSHGGLDWDRVRATQRFYLYGFAGDELPSVNFPLASRGWEMIARVNTDEFFEVSLPRSRPAQQASSITAAHGRIGRYRYLLWDVRPSVQDHSSNPPHLAHTFYGEIDVDTEPD